MDISSASKVVAVVGATGTQGQSVVKALYRSGRYKIRALTRNVQSASATALQAQYPQIELVEVTSDDMDAFRKPFQNVDIVFGVTRNLADYDFSHSSSGNPEFEHGKAMVDAAIAENVDTFVYSGMDSLEKLSRGKYKGAMNFESKQEISQYLLSKYDQIRGFLVYSGYYMENYLSHARISEEDKNTVLFRIPLPPTTMVPLIDTANDMGNVVVHLLDFPEKYQGKAVEVSGGFYEAQEMVKAFTEVTGRPAKYVQTPFDVTGVEMLTKMFRSISEFGYFGGRDTFIDVLKNEGVKFTTPVEFWKARNWSGPAKKEN
ncbi:hypothetical protein H4R99_000572 [Coemansia sp. RSA 1722]|nr:hypothetical protein LPJ57_000264 [Coemansia sp. RSA 486]KAJ2238066.1 hypothetical protein IWW45_000406 [Coemansia sp. RSA 485]KAJ2603575.1 hypothetical protein GGF39_000068 [Coemansia sp. RSA 1721]KAJ2606177.1 hypothetical protein H4R99_000572 [Coemansia sp. RSA 1722]KAJ2639700.1 hypothetical protein GGF40_000666 [Coemansia sp. RSA 1286]